MIKVTVPATSANLAVGFDCLGLAVDLTSTFTFQDNQSALTITGCPSEFQNTNNLVFKGFKAVADYLNQPMPNIAIDIVSDVPVSRGLGSSATCIVGGLLGANEWFGGELAKSELLKLATAIEGHPDNVAPAIYGGLCLATIDAQQNAHVVQYPINSTLKFFVIIPNFKISTKDARAVLPKTMDYADVTFQVSHGLLLIQALKTGNLGMLREAMRDRMHEPYRAKLIDHFAQVKATCEQQGAILYISGSGSTLMGITDNDATRVALISKISQAFPDWRVQAVQVAKSGAQVSMSQAQAIQSEALSNR